METWKDIKGYEGLYQISNEGRVKSLERTIMRKDGKTMKFKSVIKNQFTDKDGYKRVTLSKGCIAKHYFVHRLVAQTFIGDIDGHEINHIDFDTSNNCVTNLEIVDHLDNIRHSYNQGHYSEINKKKITVTYKDGSTSVFDSYKEAASCLGISYGGLNKIINKRRSGKKVFDRLNIKKIEKGLGGD